MAESFVKAIYDYRSGETGDLPFNAGDVIKVISDIDENWINGEFNGKVGLFPANFVEQTTIAGTADEEYTVVAKETFVSGEDGVLTYFMGDRITFLGYVDGYYWCKGQLGEEIGLFPASTVDGLDKISKTFKKPVHSQTTASQSLAIVSPTASHDKLSAKKPVSVDLSQPCVQSLYNFQGDSEFELSFNAGEMISLTNEIDNEWFEGTYKGKSGMFPKSFVNILTPLTQTDEVEDDNILSQNAEASVDDVVPFAIAVYPFVGETRHELSFREGDIIYLNSWVSPEWIEGECDGITGIFPSSFVQIQVELPNSFEESVKSDWENRNGDMIVKPGSFKVGDKATAIYSFATDTKGDLPLEVGDLIRIERVVDEEWVEGRKNDVQVGLCPAVFLQIQDVPLNTMPAQYTENQSTTASKDTYNETSNIVNEYEKYNHKPTNNRTKSTPNSLSDNSRSPQPLPNNYDNNSNFSFAIEASGRNKTKGPSIYKDTSDVKQTKPPLGPKPNIAPKPDFLKKSSKSTSDKSLNSSKMSEPVIANRILSAQSSKALNEATVQQKHTVQNTIQSKSNSTTSPNGWVTFDDQSNHIGTSKDVSPKQANSSQDLSGMSYRTLLDKSLDEDMPSPVLKPVALPARKIAPSPPPRIDLQNRSVSDNVLSNKLAQEAGAFECDHRKSPSLNELRDVSQTSNNQLRPVPVRRKKLLQPRPASYHSDSDTGVVNCENGFPILHELEDQITSLNNELQKETKVLSGVDVLIEMVNDPSKREELESKKAITERKMYELKRELRKTQEHQKHLVKSVAGFSSYLEIKLKIEQLRESIQENIDTKNSLQSLLLQNEDEETIAELQENVVFCEHAITNLEAELKSLQNILEQLEGGGSTREESSSGREKDVKHRIKVISEILDTEKSFGQDLNLCVHHYMEQLKEWNVDGIDYEVLFGNMPEVAALSTRLLTKLDAATQDVDVSDQVVGSCFVDFSEEITNVYGTYCRNHDDAIAFLEKSANNEEIQQYFKKCLDSIREHSSCWDLSSFLIKPVQRILKYPLLLNQLLKNTPDDHPDKTGLIKAIEVMTRAANDVNEFKRRKDLVQKYQKVEDTGLSTKIQKFTWHSVVKKSTRFNQRITQFTGLKFQTVDEKFNEIEKVFYQIEKTIKNFIKNIAQYLEQFEEVHVSQITTAENILDYHQPDTVSNEIQEFYDAQKNIADNSLTELKNVLDEDVLAPLNGLIRLLEGPRRLIQKRHDKCLDYDSWTNKIEKIKDKDKLKQAKEELEFAKRNYEALNAQLLDELPVLNEKAIIFLQTCITNFADVHKQFYVDALDQFSSSVQLSSVQTGGSDIISDFLTHGKLATHNVFQLTFVPMKNLAAPKPARPMLSPKSSAATEDMLTRSNSLKRSSSDRNKRLSPDVNCFIVRSHTVSAGDKCVLKKKLDKRKNLSSSSFNSLSRADLYVAKYMFIAENDSELSVSKGNVVKVLQYHDNIGNSEWWKVEYGGDTGYVPAHYLIQQADSPANGGPLVK